MTEKKPQPQTSTNDSNFDVHRIYVKDISFEVPTEPAKLQGEWHPEILLQLNTSTKELTGDAFEAILTVTVTAKQDNDTYYLVEVKQAGVFTIKGFDDEKTAAMLGIYCPSTLFPFARETISELVVKGGFPQLLLTPINFDTLYEQRTAKKDAVASDS